MAWQDVFPLTGSRIDAEQERELRLTMQARAGAEWALAALVARYQPPVTRYLTRLTGSPELARTLAEHIFVRMDRRLRGPHGGQHLRLWLLRACTEAGLDALRHPQQANAPRLGQPHGPAGLLAERVGGNAMDRLRAGLDALAEATGTTSRQVRKLIWPVHPDANERGARTQQFARSNTDRWREQMSGNEDDLVEEQDPREALRFRMVRAVLVEMPYGDAMCLALHLIAGLNQAEVAKALGLTSTATRRRVVQGLQRFAQRYEAALASLGLSSELTPTRTTPLPRTRMVDLSGAADPGAAADGAQRRRVPDEQVPLPGQAPAAISAEPVVPIVDVTEMTADQSHSMGSTGHTHDHREAEGMPVHVQMAAVEAVPAVTLDSAVDRVIMDELTSAPPPIVVSEFPPQSDAGAASDETAEVAEVAEIATSVSPPGREPRLVPVLTTEAAPMPLPAASREATGGEAAGRQAEERVAPRLVPVLTPTHEGNRSIRWTPDARPGARSHDATQRQTVIIPGLTATARIQEETNTERS